jgi:glucan phosphorylase
MRAVLRIAVRHHWAGRFQAASLDAIADGTFSPDDPVRFASLVDELRHGDRYLTTVDFEDYWRVQREIDAAWKPRSPWRRNPAPSHGRAPLRRRGRR